jgi:hypothetical protein
MSQRPKFEAVVAGGAFAEPRLICGRERDAQDELAITKKTIDELERLIGTYRAATRKSS